MLFVYQMLALSLRLQKQEYNSYIIASSKQITHLLLGPRADKLLIFHPNGKLSVSNASMRCRSTFALARDHRCCIVLW